MKPLTFKETKHLLVLRAVVDIDESDNKMLVTELCSNMSLAAWAKKSSYTKLSLEKKGKVVMKLLNQLTYAIDVLHKRNITHRDIKPQNVFVTKSEDFVLGDYGMVD